MVNQRIAKIAKRAIEFRGRVHPAPVSVRRGNKALKISSLVAPCPRGKAAISGRQTAMSGRHAATPVGQPVMSRPARRAKIVKIVIE
jgi:hypothetical protein